MNKLSQFNRTHHRRPRHRGLINGAVWSAHDRAVADNEVGDTTSIQENIEIRSAA